MLEPKLKIPEGYELAEEHRRAINLDTDKHYLNDYGYECPVIKVGDYGKHLYFILRKIPTWEWPSLFNLNYQWLIQQPNMTWFLSEEQPTIYCDSYWLSKTGLHIISKMVCINWPECEGWRDSLIHRRDCEVVMWGPKIKGLQVVTAPECRPKTKLPAYNDCVDPEATLFTYGDLLCNAQPIYTKRP